MRVFNHRVMIDDLNQSPNTHADHATKINSDGGHSGDEAEALELPTAVAEAAR